MKKICLIIHSLGIGGMERVMTQLANNFVERQEAEVHVILIGRKREVVYQLSELVKVHKPKFEFNNNRRIIDMLRTVKFLRTQVKKINPDTVLSLGEIWNNLVLLSLYGLSVPIFVSDRCQPNKSLGKVHNWLRKKLYPIATGVIAQTTIAQKIYEQQNLNKNIKVIGNPVYNIPISGKERKENIILTVGRLIETKHHDRLITIFKNIAMNGWKLVIVGGDALKQDGMKRLKKLVAKLNLQESIELVGTVSDIDKYYQKSKIFAFTSSSEGFPNVIGEAMSAGLPVVAYDCVAGPSDMIENEKNGFLVPLFDDENFSKKLEWLVHNEKLRQKMGQASRELIEKFSLTKTGEQYYKFILSHYESPTN